jgi:hypothetical protein
MLRVRKPQRKAKDALQNLRQSFDIAEPGRFFILMVSQMTPTQMTLRMIRITGRIGGALKAIGRTDQTRMLSPCKTLLAIFVSGS